MTSVHLRKLDSRGDVNKFGHQFGPVINECQIDKYSPRKYSQNKTVSEQKLDSRYKALSMKPSKLIKFSLFRPLHPLPHSKPPSLQHQFISHSAALVGNLTHLLHPSILLLNISSIGPFLSHCLLPLPWVRLSRLLSLIILYPHPTSFILFPE